MPGGLDDRGQAEDAHPYDSRLVAVTGADGFLGTHLQRTLAQSGFRVRALTRTTGPDLRDVQAGWGAALEGADIVVHLAGKAHDLRTVSAADAAEYVEVNARGAGRVASAAAIAGATRFIHVSTVKVLGEGPRDGRRFQETDDLAPVGVYAESKAEAEQTVASVLAGTTTECVIVRLPLVFGTPFKGNLATIESALRKGVPLPVGHPSIGARTYVMVSDLMELLIRVVTAPEGLPPVLHARSAPDLTAADVTRLVADEIGRRARIVSVPAGTIHSVARLTGRPEIASKLCDPMLVADDITRSALGLGPAPSCA